jgi:hypothetical protein
MAELAEARELLLAVITDTIEEHDTAGSFPGAAGSGTAG